MKILLISCLVIIFSALSAQPIPKGKIEEFVAENDIDKAPMNYRYFVKINNKLSRLLYDTKVGTAIIAKNADKLKHSLHQKISVFWHITWR